MGTVGGYSGRVQWVGITHHDVPYFNLLNIKMEPRELHSTELYLYCTCRKFECDAGFDGESSE